MNNRKQDVGKWYVTVLGWHPDAPEGLDRRGFTFPFRAEVRNNVFASGCPVIALAYNCFYWAEFFTYQKR